MGILTDLTSINLHNQSSSSYHIYPGKSSSQELHRWEHYPSSTKWYYDKDSTANWFWFYNALHKKPPTNEKIVSWYLHWSGTASSDQLWAY